MRRTVPLALLLLAACSGSPKSSGSDGGTKPAQHEYIPISGTVQFHPLEQLWRAGTIPGAVAASSTALPGLDGATLNVEDSVDALIGRPPLAQTTLGADGKFSFAQVDVVNVSVALVADVSPTSTLMESGFGLYRYEAGKPRPTSLLNMPVWIISKEFEAMLAKAAGLTTDDLEQGGFVLGQIVVPDANDALHNQGVEGAQLAQEVPASNGFKAVALQSTNTNPDASPPLYYLNSDLTGLATGDQTSSSGVFLFFPGVNTIDCTALKSGQTFAVHLVGARHETALAAYIEQQ